MKSRSNRRGQVVLDACYIQSGGGYVYLKMLSELLSDLFDVIIISNRTYDLPYNQILVKNFIRKEFQLYVLRNLPTICISNVPSIWKNYTIFFLHQRYYVDPGYNHFDSSIKLKFKRLFFRLNIYRQKNVYVQTKVMQMLCEKMSIKALVNPFLLVKTLPVNNKKYQVLFINDSVNHKRKFTNLATLEKLMLLGLDLIVVGEELYLKGAKNVGARSHEEMLNLFAESVAFVSFSKFESLCLPLIEAALHSCACICYRSDFAEELLQNYICIDDFNRLSGSHELLLEPSVLREKELFTLTKIQMLEILYRELCQR